ncbi:hypothetical protein Kisp01_28790 [Kineosporia sp. NBRC 101677]|uniref:DUF2235 domain-containing protein n=1 Tax=Kineosporia sp. NBRC 101677 TaxID=3032197 RepID=UPI0024A43A7A|nr:DUF2235 domain-containing protein [Kineosporia sp. NBRC 101677]GLY15864.1 hypothetical protein Kisp01_28790 [Kineosporia sp. NBRC 101677]
MKRLALFFDGTWNRPSARTNVSRMHAALAGSGPDGVEQRSVYVQGVGTRWGEWLRGGVLGFGTAGNIRQGYEWLVQNYDDGDEIFLFGFSRGAFTARSLAGMIARCGLTDRRAPISAEEVYRRYQQGPKGHAPGARAVDIHFLGVWDTVGALGVPWGRIRGLSRSTIRFHNTNPSVRYRNMFHALAIDENRQAYAPTLWTAFSPKDVPLQLLREDQTLEQRWFTGAHSDVGGNRDDPSLARIPLAWLWARAQECGLHLEGSAPLEAGDHLLPVEDSFGSFLLGFYRITRLGRPFHRPIGRLPQATRKRPGWSHSLNETIDGSVFDRWRDDPDYRPANLVAWAARQGVDPATVQGATPAIATGELPQAGLS